MNILDYFTADWAGPAFEPLDTTHLAALGALVLLALFLIRFRNSNDGVKGFWRWMLALLLWGNEIAWHYWNYISGNWSLETMLPLDLGRLLVWVAAWMLVTKSYKIYEFVYFMGIAAAVLTLARPDMGSFGFPHFRFFHTFLANGLIFTAALYMTIVEGMRPTWKSMIRVFVWMNLYAVAVYFINDYIGSNYLLVNHKPEIGSLLDRLPEWPVYILYMEVIGIIAMLLLYLPFAIKDLRSYYLLNKDNASRLDSILK